MVKVERITHPISLVQNSRTWTQELLDQIQICGDYKKVDSSYKNRYNKPDIKTALENMYGEKCCYCESHIGAQTYGQIEHRQPKHEFPDQAFNWNNLHWSCQVCNTNKGKYWSPAAPILDAAVDTVESHLDFDLETCEIIPKNNSTRATTTIRHAKLNRPALIKARQRLLREITILLQRLQATESAEDREYYRLQLDSLTVNDPANGDIAVHSLFIRTLLHKLAT